MTHIRLPETDFVGPSGNSTDKYTSRNPLVRLMVARFLREIDAAVSAAGPRSILDVGCGEGFVTTRLARVASCPVIGVDLGDLRLREHWQRRAGASVSFQAGSAYDLPFADRSFECVCALEVLEHLERPLDAIEQLRRVATRALLVSVPREPLWRIVHLLAGRDIRHLGNTPGHINHWTSRAFVRLIGQFARVTLVSRPFPWTVVLAEPHDGPGR